MAVDMNETEAKYEAPAGRTLPDLDDLPQVAGTSGPDEEDLEAEYYDTSDLRLIRAGITLRRRRGGDDAGWHLKLPVGTDTRREIRLPLGRAGRPVPGELAELVRAHTRGEPLRPVARITTSRQRLTLLDQGGESLAEPAHPAPLKPSSPAGQVVLAYLRAYADRLKSLDPMVRRDEPDAVHQMRVATRRLRSMLQSFKKIIR